MTSDSGTHSSRTDHTPAGRERKISTVDADEIANFEKMADHWWDPNGPFKPLHQLNPTRLAFIRGALDSHFSLNPAAARPLQGLRLLDIGCGGGLVSEPMARLGASVTGVDASEKNIGTASVHAERSGITIDYRATTAESLAENGEHFDIVINLEVVEHVADVTAYLKACRQLIKPGGIMLVSTLNRTAKSFAMAIVGAEYVMRWLPRGTHDWTKFITPAELSDHLEQAGFDTASPQGFIFNPLTWRWALSSRDTAVNYAIAATPRSMDNTGQ